MVTVGGHFGFWYCYFIAVDPGCWETDFPAAAFETLFRKEKTMREIPFDDDLMNDAREEAAGAMRQLQHLVCHTEFGIGYSKLSQLRDRADELIDKGGKLRLSPDEAMAVAAALDFAGAMLQQVPAVDDDDPL